jgi:hypothetical protein
VDWDPLLCVAEPTSEAIADLLQPFAPDEPKRRAKKVLAFYRGHHCGRADYDGHAHGLPAPEPPPPPLLIPIIVNVFIDPSFLDFFRPFELLRVSFVAIRFLQSVGLAPWALTEYRQIGGQMSS